VASESSQFLFGTAGRIEAGAMVRLSKIVDYLVDNLYTSMLSPTRGWDQEESGWTEARLPDLGMCDPASRPAGNQPSDV